jgi:hypothetical protein
MLEIQNDFVSKNPGYSLKHCDGHRSKWQEIRLMKGSILRASEELVPPYYFE